MRKTIILTLIVVFSQPLFAQSPTPTPIIIIQSSSKDIFDYILFGIQCASLIALIVYVIKTWNIASANKISAEMSQKSIEISQKSIEMSQIAIEISQKESMKSLELSKATLEEMKQARFQEIAPHIVVYFDMPYGRDWQMFFVVKNTGKTIATDIRINFNPSLQTGWGNKISDFTLPLIKNGISSLAPNQEIRTPFDSVTNYFVPSMVELLNGELPKKYEIIVSYSNLLNEGRTETKHAVDFTMFDELTVLGEKGEKDLIKAIETISDTGKRVEKSLERMSAKIIEGVSFRNLDTSNINFQLSPEIWKVNTLAKLNEFKIIWESIYAGNISNPAKFHIENLQSKFSIISYQLVAAAAQLDSFISTNLNQILIEIAVKIAELSNWQFYYEGDNGLNDVGNEVVNLITIAIERINREVLSN